MYALLLGFSECYLDGLLYISYDTGILQRLLIGLF